MLKQSLICFLTIPLLLTGCTPADSIQDQKVVVTTFVPYFVFTQNLAGDNIQLINLINNTQEPHDYQLKPSDLATLQKADLIIRNGLGIDDWVVEAAEKSGSQAQIFTASDYITPLPPQHSEVLDASTGEIDDHNDAFDPHLWVSPKNVLQLLPHLQTALSTIDTNHTASYQENLSKYIATLQALDTTITEQLQPYIQKQFISFHEAFQYFARDYGLVSAISIESYPGKEPTPKYLQSIIQLIKEKQIKAIFSEPQFSPRIVETLAQDLHLQVFSLDPMETGTASPTFYQDITLKNVQNIVAALKL